MTPSGRDVLEVDALVTDRYLDSLLAAGDHADDAPDLLQLPGPGSRRGPWFLTALRRAPDPDRLDQGVRLASERLTRDLPRFHPSFRFEERLAVRLAEAASSMRLSAAAGGRPAARAIPFRGIQPGSEPPGTHALGVDLTGIHRHNDHVAAAPRPLLVGGAVAASAISLAGAAWVAWRRSRPGGTPMARAARAAHALRARPAPPIRGRLV